MTCYLIIPTCHQNIDLFKGQTKINEALKDFHIFAGVLADDLLSNQSGIMVRRVTF